jgi:hypothetical protein
MRISGSVGESDGTGEDAYDLGRSKPHVDAYALTTT